jgi:hypothetical protein
MDAFCKKKIESAPSNRAQISALAYDNNRYNSGINRQIEDES